MSKDKDHEKEEEAISDEHPTVEKRDMHNNDQKLRAAGFRIEHRPKDGPAIWSLWCKTVRIKFTEPDALLRISKPAPEPS